MSATSKRTVGVSGALAGSSLLLVGSFFVGSFLVGGVARAQEPAPIADASHDAEARGLFDAGAAAYRDGRYADALDYFTRSYDLSSRPELLYNMAVSEEYLGHGADALAHFRLYLERVPDAANRAEVEGRIASLSRPAQPAPGPTPPPAAPAPGPDPVGLGLSIGGGVVVALGAGLLVATVLDQQAVDGAAPGTAWSSVSDAAERVPVLSAVGWIALGVGAAAATAGIVVLATNGGAGGAPEVRASVGLGGLRVEGRF